MPLMLIRHAYIDVTAIIAALRCRQRDAADFITMRRLLIAILSCSTLMMIRCYATLLLRRDAAAMCFRRRQAAMPLTHAMPIAIDIRYADDAAAVAMLFAAAADTILIHYFAPPYDAAAHFRYLSPRALRAVISSPRCR